MRTIIRRLILSLVIWSIPLLAIPPWIHVDPVDARFSDRPFGEFDRHAPRWQPPFAAAVRADSTTRLPVRIDTARLVREVIAASAITYWLLTVLAEARRAFGGREWLLRMSLPKVAALLALLLPVPPVGVLAFTPWAALADWNHGIPALLPYSILWLLLATATFVALWPIRYLLTRSLTRGSTS